MHIEHITDGDAPGFDGPLVPEGRIFPGAPLGRVPRIIAFEMLAGGARVLVSLPRRQEQVEMGLLGRAAERRGIMKGVGAAQPVATITSRRSRMRCMLAPCPRVLGSRIFHSSKALPR